MWLQFRGYLTEIWQRNSEILQKLRKWLRSQKRRFPCGEPSVSLSESPEPIFFETLEKPLIRMGLRGGMFCFLRLNVLQISPGAGERYQINGRGRLSVKIIQSRARRR